MTIRHYLRLVTQIDFISSWELWCVSIERFTGNKKRRNEILNLLHLRYIFFFCLLNTFKWMWEFNLLHFFFLYSLESLLSSLSLISFLFFSLIQRINDKEISSISSELKIAVDNKRDEWLYRKKDGFWSLRYIFFVFIFFLLPSNHVFEYIL